MKMIVTCSPTLQKKIKIQLVKQTLMKIYDKNKQDQWKQSVGVNRDSAMTVNTHL